LAEAGYPDGEGMRTLELICSEGAKWNLEQPTYAVKIQADLATIGINADVTLLSSTAWSTRHAYEGNYDLSTATTGYDYPDPDNWVAFGYHSQDAWYLNIYESFDGKVKGPDVVCNSEYDTKIKNAAAQIDVEDRRATYDEIIRHFAPIDYFIWGWQCKPAFPMNKKFKDWSWYDPSAGFYLRDASFSS